MPLLKTRAPAWVLPNALYDLDFINQRWYGGFIDQKGGEDPTSLMIQGGAYGSPQIPFTPQRNGILLAGLFSQNRITDMGLAEERASTNYAIQCRDLSNAAWSASNMTVTKNQIGNDTTSIRIGSSNICSLTATANNATVSQTITLSSTALIESFYIKRLSGTGTIKISKDGGSTYTDVTAAVAGISAPNISGFAWVQGSAIQTLTNPTLTIQLGTSGDSIAVDFSQLEAAPKTGNMGTTPIVTTTVSLNRTNNPGFFQSTAVKGAFPNAGARIIHDVFCTGGPSTMLMSWNGDVSTSVNTGPAMIATDFTPGAPQSWNGGIGGGFSTGNATSNQGTNGRGNWNKTCGRVNGHGSQGCINGGALSANATGANHLPALNPTATHFNIGNNGSGTNDDPLNGFIGRVTFWNEGITDGQMMEYTSLTNPYGIY